jgi:hypothetical protein
MDSPELPSDVRGATVSWISDAIRARRELPRTIEYATKGELGLTEGSQGKRIGNDPIGSHYHLNHSGNRWIYMNFR